MKIFKHYLRSSFRLVSKLSIRRFVCAIVLVEIFFLLFYAKLIYYLNYCCFTPENVIISLTTTPKRFQFELPFTLHSLLTQTSLPKEIRIYLSPAKSLIQQTNLTLDHLKFSLEQIDSSVIIRKLFDKLVRIQFEDEDYGPATKFLPIIKEFHGLTSTLSKSQAILICDDDHYYHPYTVTTLVKYSNLHKNSIIGLRGWRGKNFDFDSGRQTPIIPNNKQSLLKLSISNILVREDLTWGVSDAVELTFHVAYAFRLSDIYRVGIVTANHGYVIRPSFFDSQIYLDFHRAPRDVTRVDDIWLSGHASKRNISRLVVPTCCASISITRTHELENYFVANHISRSSANDHALQWFNQAWEKDLWYKFKGVNRPKYVYWWTKLYRNWISLIFRLKYFIYVGFV